LRSAPAPPDLGLQQRLRAGDREALTVLFERHREHVFALCWRLAGASVAEDLLQETFLRVWLYRASVTGRAKFSTWLYAVARNVCRDYLRRCARERSLGEEARVDALVAATPHPRGRAEGRLAIRELVAMLGPDAREALILSRFHGLSYREIGEICGCTEGAVKVRIHRALERLRTAVENKEARHGL